MSKRPAARAPLPPSRRGWIPAVCLGLAALTLAVYWQTFQFRFVDLDDQLYITDNPSITNGVTLPGVAAAFDYRSSDNWVPLTTLSHMLDCQLFGLQPGWHHGVNVVLHLFSAVLLFLVLRQMTGALWPAAFVATVFAIHPLHVESVAWVSERKDTLSGVFFMLTLALYVRYARRPQSLVNYLMVLAVFGIGLLAKPMLITVPFVLLLLDYWPLKRFADASGPGVTPFSRLKMLPVPVQLFAEKIPLMLVAAADGVLTLLAEKGGIQPLNAFPLPARIENALISYVTQAAKMFWPANLAPFYPFPAAFPVWLIAGALAFLVSTSAWAWLERRRRPYLLTGWLWYLVMLLPVIGFVQVGLQSMADRHTYLPQIGLYLIVAFGVSDLAARWRHRRFLLGAAAGIAIVVLAVLAGRQASWWQNNRLLWTRAVACQPESAFAHYNLGNDLLRSGQLDDALSQLEQALKFNPADAQTENDLGAVLVQKGDSDAAIPHFQKAVELDPTSALAEFNLGNVFREKGQADEAIRHYDNGLQLTDDPGVESAVGRLLLKKKRWNDAAARFERALKLDPSLTRAQEGAAYVVWALATSPDRSVRDGPKAMELARRADQLAGGKNPIVTAALAAACAETGRFPDAVANAELALRLAREQNQTNLVPIIQKQLRCYQAATPFRDPSLSR